MLFTPTTVTLFAKQEAVKHVLAVHTSAIEQLKHATDTDMYIMYINYYFI